MSADVPFHPVANSFPLVEEAEFDSLVEDIKANGLREPITLHPDGSILDGRNRYRACREAGVEPRFVQWDSAGSVEAFVISKNLARRHLTPSQRAMIAARLATLAEGRPRKTRPSGRISQGEAARELNVGERTVRRARQVIEQGSPELREAVERGEISVSKAASRVRPPAPVPGPAPPPEKPKPSKQTLRLRENAALWRQLRDAVEAINGLPDVETICGAVPAARREWLSRRLPVVRDWLKGLQTAWNEREEKGP
jgi:ParB-like chromosome segregation protein Spo0J